MTFAHCWADLQYAAKRASGILTKTFKPHALEIPSRVQPAFSEVTETLDIAVPMRDGVRLFTDVYRPVASGKFPAVLIRMPYGKRETYCYMPVHGRFWAKRGYVCVIQDVRGKWSSEGAWDPFVNEANDGYDTIDWVSKQDWCDGNVGMTGESYYGYTQLAAATSQHPNLKCIVPGDTAADIFGVWVYNSNALCLQTMGIWAPETNSRTYANYFRLDPWHLPIRSADDDAGIPSPYYKEWIDRPLRDAYWEKINLDSLYEKITIPVLSWGGWYDTFLKGTIDDWAGIKREALKAGRAENQYLLIAATDHEVTPMWTGRIGKLEVGKDAWSYDKIHEFFECFLKGANNGLKERGKVEIFVMGDNSWRTEHEWPLVRAVTTPYFLHSTGDAQTSKGSGTLDLIAPRQERSDEFHYDPKDPVAPSLKENLWRRAESMQDRAPFELRNDVLCYTTKPLEGELEITGPILLELFAASSAVSTDFTATLVDVFPDGYCHLIQEGIVRTRFRDAKTDAMMEPGKAYQFTIDLWATSYVFKHGHKIRLEISSSNFDRYDRNLNSSTTYGLESVPLIAKQTIYHDEARPSRLLLPVIPRP